jgi:hypothetical protein
MTDGGCNGEDDGSNCEDVAVEAGAGAAGFMTRLLVRGYSEEDVAPRMLESRRRRRQRKQIHLGHCDRIQVSGCPRIDAYDRMTPRLQRT